jgi:hypothetical protein
MSIAMSVVVAPSRRLRFLMVGFGASLLAAACAAGCFAPVQFTAGPAVALALLFAGVCVTHAALGPAMVHRIDISGPGQLRLTVQQGVRPDKSAALPARLLPGSTLWPRLLLLRLETVDEGRRRRVCRVAVLPDSVSPEAFRALAVAFGAGGGATAASSTGHKIL